MGYAAKDDLVVMKAGHPVSDRASSLWNVLGGFSSWLSNGGYKVAQGPNGRGFSDQMLSCPGR